MFSQEFIQIIIDGLVVFATDLLLPFMATAFVLGMVLRALFYFTVKREDWFAREFEKRVHRFVDDDQDESQDPSFYNTVKRLLEKTYYELFEVRAIMQRRKPDQIASFNDRVFLIQHGAALVVKDTLKQVRYLKHGSFQPKLLEISKNIFQNNPCFTKIAGIIPGSVNDVLNIMPGLFIIGGIFGTFLGIMKALPELGNMDLADVEGTKMIMDQFLMKISFSMSTSIVGIVLSVIMTLYNAVLSPEKLFISIVDRFENSLDILWNRSKNNDIYASATEFDEHKDPLEALAEQAVENEAMKRTELMIFDLKSVFSNRRDSKEDNAEPVNDSKDDNGDIKDAS